jgi:hypothetical protein
MRHRRVEDDGGDGGVDGEDPITTAATFSFSSSLSSPDEPLDVSRSMSQSPTIYALPFFFLWYSLFLPSLFLYGLFFF